jgi:hypothetical protein
VLLVVGEDRKNQPTIRNHSQRDEPVRMNCVASKHGGAQGKKVLDVIRPEVMSLDFPDVRPVPFKAQNPHLAIVATIRSYATGPAVY